MPDEDLDGPYAIVTAEAQARPIRSTPLEVIDGSASSIGFPGSLLVFIAPRGSSALDEVRAAARGDENSANQLRSRYGQQVGEEPSLAAHEAVAEAMAAAPVFAHFLHGGEVLNRGLFLPEGAELVGTALAYTGGRLSPDGCALTEYYQPDSDLELEGVVVQIAPPLTDAETALLEHAPPDRVVEAAVCEATTWWGVTLAAGLVAGAYGTYVVATVALAAMAADDQIDRLSEDEIAGLGDSASIDQLMEMRRRLLRTRLRGESQ
jgi:hypothetical protein